MVADCRNIFADDWRQGKNRQKANMEGKGKGKGKGKGRVSYCIRAKDAAGGLYRAGAGTRGGDAQTCCGCWRWRQR
jgi:hypothetical protein